MSDNDKPARIPQLRDMTDYAKHLETEVERLREAFAELLEEAQDMRDYVPEYFAKKWHHDEALDRARAVRKEWEYDLANDPPPREWPPDQLKPSDVERGRHMLQDAADRGEPWAAAVLLELATYRNVRSALVAARDALGDVGYSRNANLGEVQARARRAKGAAEEALNA